MTCDGTVYVIRSSTHDWVSIWPSTKSRENSGVLTVGSTVCVIRDKPRYDCDGNPRFRVKVMTIPVVYNKERGINFAMPGQKGWLKTSYIPSLPQPKKAPPKKKKPAPPPPPPPVEEVDPAINFQSQIKTAVREAIEPLHNRISGLEEQSRGLSKTVDTLRNKIERRDVRIHRKDDQILEQKQQLAEQKRLQLILLKKNDEKADRLQRQLQEKSLTIEELQETIESQVVVIATQQNSISELQARYRWL